MKQNIEQFQKQLTERVEYLRQRLGEVKANIDGSVNESRETLDLKRKELESRVEASQQRLVDAKARARQWIEAKAAETGEKVAEWEYQREVDRLERRADAAEDYAASTIILATIAIDEAELAIVEAIAARLLAEDAKYPGSEFVVQTGT